MVKTKKKAAPIPRGRLTRDAEHAQPEGRHRQVFKSDEVPHRWANLTQRFGCNQHRNFYFEGARLFSYGRHYLAARLVTNRRGQTFALVNDYRYSSTTAGHLNAAKHALREEVRWFEVPNPGADTYGEHSENFEKLRRDVFSLLEKSQRARGRKAGIMRDAFELSKNANAYAAAVGLKARLKPCTAGIMAEYRRAQRLEAAVNRNAAARMEDIRAAHAAKLAVDVAEWDQRLAAWKAGDGENPGSYPGYDRTGQTDHLRVRGSRIETTQGVIVPLAACLPILESIRAGRLIETGALMIDGFELRNFDLTARTLAVGCHRFTFDEIERAAAVAGL